MRKMATIRKIISIRPIEGADAIEGASVDGWNVVIKKNEYQVGDSVIYCEIDSWIPTEIAPFLSKGKEPREFEGVKGEVLRTVRLRGQVSQGLILPMSLLNRSVVEGEDVSGDLGILKYEPPIPAQLTGSVKGNFPGFIPKTNQERIQNLSAEFDQWNSRKFDWEVTEKLDGTSMTVYCRDGELGVCSRNLELKETSENSLWSIFRNSGLDKWMRNYNRNIAIQGELIGEGIQGNPYKIKGHRFMIFDIFDIDSGNHQLPYERYAAYNLFRDLVDPELVSHVPVENLDMRFSDEDIETMDHLLRYADASSFLSPSVEREGLVFKNVDNSELSFKVISNKWLLKTGN